MFKCSLLLKAFKVSVQKKETCNFNISPKWDNVCCTVQQHFNSTPAAAFIMPSPLYGFFSFLPSTIANHRRQQGKTKVKHEIRKMYISVPLLFFFIGSASAKKQGNFGIFTACTDERKNGSLRLQCFYQECPYTSHTTFSCEFKMDKKTLAIKENMMCKNYSVPLTVHNPKEDDVTNFTCILTRKQRKETKNITINYSIQKGQHHIPGCRAAAPTSLWPVVILSLWRVLDSQLT